MGPTDVLDPCCLLEGRTGVPRLKGNLGLPSCRGRTVMRPEVGRQPPGSSGMLHRAHSNGLSQVKFKFNRGFQKLDLFISPVSFFADVSRMFSGLGLGWTECPGILSLPHTQGQIGIFPAFSVVLLWEATGLIVPIALFLAVCHLAVPSSLTTVLYWPPFLPCGFV